MRKMIWKEKEDMDYKLSGGERLYIIIGSKNHSGENGFLTLRCRLSIL